MRLLSTLLLATILMTISSQGIAARLKQAVADEPANPAVSTMQSDGVDLNQAVEQVRRQCNGRIVSAVTKRSGNRETHEIKCLTEDGKVRTFRVPGKRNG